MEALRDLLKSKKFATSAIALVFMVIVQIFPGLSPAQVDLFSQTILVLWGGVVGGFTIVEAAAAARSGTTKYDKE